MNLETKITIYKFTPQLFTLTRDNSKAYGDNSKGYGDRIHPYKKV